MYICAKSIPIANKLVTLANGYKQMLIVLNQLAVFFSIVIGQKSLLVKILTNQQRCRRVVKIWSQGPKFDHSPQTEWLLLNKRRSMAK